MAGFGAASQPIVGKPDSYALRAEADCDCVDTRCAQKRGATRLIALAPFVSVEPLFRCR